MLDLTMFCASKNGRYAFSEPFVQKKRKYYTDAAIIVGERVDEPDTVGDYPSAVSQFANWPKPHEFSSVELPFQVGKFANHEEYNYIDCHEVYYEIGGHLFDSRYVAMLLCLPSLKIKAVRDEHGPRLCFTWERGAGILMGAEE